MSSIAMAWPTHEAHRSIQQWLNDRAREGWAPCPLTQNAFVRIFSNPAFSPKALTPIEALALLQANRSHRTHRFSEDEIGVVDALRPLGARLTGHRQVTDSYRVGWPYIESRLVTLDHSLLSLLAEKVWGEERC